MPFLEAILTFLAAQKWEDELVAWLEEYDAENKDVRVYVQAQNAISNVRSAFCDLQTMQGF